MCHVQLCASKQMPVVCEECDAPTFTDEIDLHDGEKPLLVCRDCGVPR